LREGGQLRSTLELIAKRSKRNRMTDLTRREFLERTGAGAAALVALPQSRTAATRRHCAACSTTTACAAPARMSIRRP